MRILFIGNSFTARNDVPRLIAELAAQAAHPQPIETRMIVAGGASLRRHWNAGVARSALNEGWDRVVLQEQSTLPLKNASRYHDNVRLFDAEIRSSGATTVLYMTWARRQADAAAHAALAATVEAIGAEVGAIVVPVGRVWQVGLASGLDLYDADGSHPNVLGSYLAACTFLARLLGERAQGQAVAKRCRVEASLAQRTHDLAWEARAKEGPSTP